MDEEHEPYDPLTEEGTIYDAEGTPLQTEFSLVLADQPPPIEKGYYEYVGKAKPGMVPGELGYVVRLMPETIYVQSRGTQWRSKREEFWQEWRPAPDGQAQRAAEMAQIMQEMSAMSAKADRVTAEAKTYNPHVGVSGELEGAELGADLAESPTALVQQRGSSAVEHKRQLALTKHAIQQFSGEIEVKHKELQALMSEQAAIMQAQVGGLMEVVERAQEAVWTINLYLGKDEQIIRLQEGEDAPPEEPISIRQMVLYMDEECAVRAEEGGIDAMSISEFDLWLKADPKHLQQVLPDRKGMVALKVRRYMKERGDLHPWLAQKLDEADRQTYFLLRNGENVWRMVTEFNTGTVLVPRRDEFLGYFKDGKTGDPLAPGTDRYMEAEKAAGAAKRHYMRAALILQGLIDRSTVFNRSGAGRVNVGDPASYEPGGGLRLVQDMEMALSDGHERFEDWIARVNEGMEVGMRVVGRWDSWDREHRDSSDRGRGGNARLSPSGSRPPEPDIYLLEGERGAGLYFHFRRKNEYRYRDTESEYFEKRGTAVIMPGDEHVLCVDAASLEEIDFFLNSRLDRHEYARMFPVLKEARALKQREAAEEAPFLLLLRGQIMLFHGARLDEVDDLLPELVSWWKTKNKSHRALVARDQRDAQQQHAKAVAEIIAEYGHRKQQKEKRAHWRTRLYPQLIALLRREEEPLLIAHKADREFVVLVPENAQNVYVREEVWVLPNEAQPGTIRRKEARSWRIVDRRWRRWDVFYTSPRWEKWKVGARPSDYLTDPEMEALTEPIIRDVRAREEGAVQRRHNYGDMVEEKQIFLPLALSVRGRKIIVHYCTSLGKIPLARLGTTRIWGVTIEERELPWRRNTQRQVCYSMEYGYTVSELGRWRKDYYREGHQHVIREWPENEAVVEERLREVRHAEREKEHLTQIVRKGVQSVEAEMDRRREVAEFHAFVMEMGSDELWEAHKKERRKQPDRYDAPWLPEILMELVETGVEVNGMTVAKAWEYFRERTGKEKVSWQQEDPKAHWRKETVEGEPDPATLDVEIKAPLISDKEKR